MKKSVLMSVMSILLTGIIVLLFNTQVLAAESGNLTDLTDTLNSNTNSENSNTNNSNTNSSNTNSSNTNRTNTNNTNTNTNNTNSSNTNRSNSTPTSIYTNNDSNLPQTGIEDSIPVAMLVVIFSISAIYAYKKIKDYRNI